MGQVALPSFVSEFPKASSFPLVLNEAASLLYDGTDEGIAMGVQHLQQDILAVSGTKPTVKVSADGEPFAVIIGQVGHSELIDRLIQSGKIQASSLLGIWETFQILTVSHPFPGMDQALVIVGSDKRGTLFGIYELSEQIGVSPWYWWADVPVKQKSNIFIDHGTYSRGTPAVKYRGIFINDEAPALAGWATKKYGGFTHTFYEKVFELILRLRGNYLWPAMWGRAFYDDDPMNGPMAEKYGIVIGTSHHEPLMRAHVEWARYGEGDWNYQTNKAILQDFWRKGMERQGTMEATISLGMRGDGDEPMSEENNIALLERIIEDQRQIIEEITGKPASETPQFWALYKEVQDYYDLGMRVPDDVMLLLCDDNWGNVRKLPAIGAEPRTGGYGMYYHFDYVGGPRNYKWLNTNPLPKIWEQLNRTYQHGVDQLWVVNVGDIKPMEFPISFFLDMAWNPSAFTPYSIEQFTRQWAASQFGDAFAPQIAHLLAKFGKMSGRIKPELLDWRTYSLHYYEEMANVSQEWMELDLLAAFVKEQLDSSYHDAFFQLVEHPIIASANVHRLYESTAKNHLYAKQGRSLTAKMASQVQELFDRDAEISRIYNEDIADGKWPHMMDQTRIGYTYWQQPEVNKIPELKTINLPSKGSLGIALSESMDFYPEKKSLTSVMLSPFDSQPVRLEVFNRGKSPIEVAISTQEPWVLVDNFKGTIHDQLELTVAIDWSQVPVGQQSAELEVRSNKEKVSITLPLSPHRVVSEGFKGFVEAMGYLAMPADAFTAKMEVNPVRWEIIPDLGKTGNAIMATPEVWATDAIDTQGSYLEYEVWVHQEGVYDVHVVANPTLNYLNQEEGLRYGIGVNDADPILVSLHAHETHQTWESWVIKSANVTKSSLPFNAGKNKLRLYMVNPGVVFQRILVDTGSMKSTFLGPPDSKFVSTKAN
ncbi:glycosyl hydrolase 115 family protein [Mongoliitalea daihaiensis]|nr:glycosyl hydrolase 115 family protein [Mongoliitalea daihaiensis]